MKFSEISATYGELLWHLAKFQRTIDTYNPINIQYNPIYPIYPNSFTQNSFTQIWRYWIILDIYGIIFGAALGGSLTCLNTFKQNRNCHIYIYVYIIFLYIPSLLSANAGIIIGVRGFPLREYFIPARLVRDQDGSENSSAAAAAAVAVAAAAPPIGILVIYKNMSDI